MFEEMLAELNTQIRSMILENVKDFISMEGQFPILMTREETAKLIGISVNPFDDKYSLFPSEPVFGQKRPKNKKGKYSHWLVFMKY